MVRSENENVVKDEAAGSLVAEEVCHQAGEPAPAEARTHVIEGVEIFKAGTWTDSAGREITYNESDLREMARAYEELAGRFEAPVKIGHSEDQGLLHGDGCPAAGWLKNLRVAGRTLVADLVDVPRAVCELIDAGAFKKRSMEILHDYLDEDTGKVYAHVPAGLALLGAALPAIGSLAGIRALYGSGSARGDVYLYARDIEGPDAEGKDADGAPAAGDGGGERCEGCERLIALEGRVEALEAAKEEESSESESESCYARGALGEKAEAVEFVSKYGRQVPPVYAPVVRDVLVMLEAGAAREKGAMREAYRQAAAEFRKFIASLGEHPALGEVGVVMEGGGAAQDDNEARIAAYCRRYGLDPDRASDYARAAIAVSRQAGQA